MRSDAGRVIGLIVAAALVLQSLGAMTDPDPGRPNALWNLVPMLLALAAGALLARRRAMALPAVACLFAAIVAQAFALFGDSTFSRTAVGAIVAVFACVFAWAYVVLPLLAWRRGRWPVDAIAFVPYAGEDTVPGAVRARVQALATLGFMPRIVHARSEGNAAATIVVLAHDRHDIVATVSHFIVNAHAFTSTRLMPLPDGSPSVAAIDAAPLTPFPSRPGHTVMLFPDADAPTLLANYVRVHGATASKAPGDAELAAAMSALTASYERWLVDSGYLGHEVRDEERRYTLKGAFSAVMRMLWPWSSLERSRLARNGRDALRGASGAGAA